MLIFDCLGGYREGETPGPIPNPEAKPLIADNTYPFRIGNVGRCLVGCFLLLLFFILITKTIYKFIILALLSAKYLPKLITSDKSSDTPGVKMNVFYYGASQNRIGDTNEYKPKI